MGVGLKTQTLVFVCSLVCASHSIVFLHTTDLPIRSHSMAVSTLNMAPYFTGYPFQGKFSNSIKRKQSCPSN
jgi:hypothetical protein